MMSDNDFKQIYDYAQMDIFNNGVILCQKKMSEAINCIDEIMQDKTINAQTRLQAAQTIIKNASVMYEVMEKLRDKAESEPFNF